MSEQGPGRDARSASALGSGTQTAAPAIDTHGFSSVSLLASWAGGARRAGGPGGSRSTQGTSLTTITLSGEKSRAQRRMFQKRQGKNVSRLTKL